MKEAARPPRLDGGRFEAGFRVRFDEAGVSGLARPSTLLRFAQDAAWQHGAAVGLDRAWYVANGLTWLVRAVDLEIRHPIPAGTSLRLSTAVVGQGRTWARRLGELWPATEPNESATGPATGDPPATSDQPATDDQPATSDGPAAVVQADWVLIDTAGRVQRISNVIAEAFAVPPATFEISRVRLGPVPAQAQRSGVTVRQHELDPNGHLNNAALLDWIDEAIVAASVIPAAIAAASVGPARPADTPPARSTADPADPADLPRRYLVEYLASLPPGARVAIATWPESDGWSVSLGRSDGTVVARARLALG